MKTYRTAKIKYTRGGGYPIRLSIIIISFNTCEITRACLESIFNADWRDEYEVIVVDNDSKDGSAEMIKTHFPEVRLIVNQENKFFSIANNQGARIARGEYLLLLNSDTLVKEDNLQRLLDYHNTLPDDVICTGPKMLNADGSLQSCGMCEMGNMWEHIANKFLLNRILPLGRIDPVLIRDSNMSHRTGWVSGAAMMVRAEAYAKVGGLNERLIFYGEEPEFGYRTKRLGYKTWYYSGAEVTHLGGKSSAAMRTHTFEEGIARYNALIHETCGPRKAWWITRITRWSLILKRIFHPNKEYFTVRIKHEKKVMEFFRKQYIQNR